MKECTYKNHVGERLLPLSAFGKHRTQPDGLYFYCKKCVNAYTTNHRKVRSPEQVKRTRENCKRYYTKQKKQYKDRYHKYQERMHTTGEGIERVLLQAARSRAKSKKIPFDLTTSDILIPKRCPIFGILLEKAKGGRAGDNSPSIDRIDSTKGYTKNNIIVISWKANRIKNSGTPEDHLKIYTFYSKLSPC